MNVCQYDTLLYTYLLLLVMFQLTPPKTSIGIGTSVGYLLNIGVLANSEIELRLGGWVSQTPG